MARKRKVALVDNDKSDVADDGVDAAMLTIMSNVQMDETFHNKYIKEMQQLYKKMDHEAFLFSFLKMIKSAMEAEESNEYAYTALLFSAKYISSYQSDETHILVIDTFKWLTSTISSSPHIRYRLCQFVNIVLNALGIEAALDDCICDSIMSYMINRLRDLSPNVRVQAILALQRLQVPDNPDDAIVKAYQFHLSADPSPRVRQAVITSMGRNYNTIPYILERLWDIDEKVRRHTYLNMSSYPVKAYKVSQRLTFLEQGLNDRSDMVRKVVTSVMLPQWLESYKRNYISFITALKLDANEAEMDRFRKITKVALKEVFKSANIDELIKCLPLENDEESEVNKCIPYETLTIEVSLYWICLTEYLQSEMADELDLIIPELSTFCSYILKFCETRRHTSDEDKWKKMEYQYILLTLIEIVYTYDLGDEIGRENLKQLIGNLLKNYELESETVEKIVMCTENLIVQEDDRLQFFVDIIKDITTWKPNDFTNDRAFIEELLDKYPDKNLKLKLSSLKVKILDLEEEERNYVERKDYVKAQEKADEKATCNEEYMNLLKPLFDQNASTSNDTDQRNLSISYQQTLKITSEDIMKCLQIAFHMVVSKKVRSLTPNVCELYKDFIRRHIESNHIAIRNWALKCGTAYSMLYGQLAKDVYNELYFQFFRNQNLSIWKTSIDCLFELVDRYGMEKFVDADKQNKNKKPGRQLYNLGILDVEEVDRNESASGYGVDFIFMMSHILDTCDNVFIGRAIITGLCRLVLHSHIKKDDIMEKLLLKYFNPATETEINQILGVFFENLIQRKKQEYLQPCLLPTIITILSAPYDSPLYEIKPETILRFVIDSTRPQFCNIGLNIHNTIALSFMQEMQNNIANKELLKFLSKELITLEIAVADDLPLQNDLIKCCENILQHELDPKTGANISNFKNILNGDFRYVQQSAHTILVEENEDNLSENESNQQIAKDTVHEEIDSNIEGEEGNSEADTPEPSAINFSKTNNIQNCNATERNLLTPTKSKNNEVTEVLRKNTHTTFGKDNATNLRHLRKSLNARNINNSDGPTRPAKVRYEAKVVENIVIQLNNCTVSGTSTNVRLEENEKALEGHILSNESLIADENTNVSQDVTINETVEEITLPISADERLNNTNGSGRILPSPIKDRTPARTRNTRKSLRISSFQASQVFSSTQQLPSSNSFQSTQSNKSIGGSNKALPQSSKSISRSTTALTQSNKSMSSLPSALSSKKLHSLTAVHKTRTRSMTRQEKELTPITTRNRAAALDQNSTVNFQSSSSVTTKRIKGKNKK